MVYSQSNNEELSEEEKKIVERAAKTLSVDWSEDLAPYKDNSHIQDLPSYQFSNLNFYIDKIIHNPTETIFLLRLVFRPQRYTNAIFYPINHKYAFYVKGKKVKKIYSTKITKIRKNGILKYRKLSDFPYKLDSYSDKWTIFSCMVHFPKISPEITKVNLIEGKPNDPNHFNFFKVELERQ